MTGPREKYNDLTLNTPAGAQLRNAQRRGIEKEGSDFLEMSRTFILFIQGSPYLWDPRFQYPSLKTKATGLWPTVYWS